VKSKLPTTFNFGHFKYKIMFAHPEDDLLTSCAGGRLDGLATQAQGLIVISCSDTYTEDYKNLVLMHEIIHTICAAHGTDLGVGAEDVIDSLAFGIIQSFAQNKWMKEYFFAN
jgi:hypothetical protein